MTNVLYALIDDCTRPIDSEDYLFLCADTERALRTTQKRLQEVLLSGFCPDGEAVEGQGKGEGEYLAWMRVFAEDDNMGREDKLRIAGAMENELLALEQDLCDTLSAVALLRSEATKLARS